MAKWLKRIIGTVVALVVLLVVAIISLPLLIDPNSFKGEIQSLAAKQGVDLQLGGPISWQFFPSVGLSLAEVSVAPISDQNNRLATVNKMTAAVAVMPLLKKTNSRARITYCRRQYSINCRP